MALISRLVDKSLVDADTSGRSARYRLLEVVRQYADVRLGESGDASDCRRRHREWYTAAAAQHDPDRGQPVVGEPSPWFDVEQDNLRAALSSAIAEDPTLALGLATSMWRFWMTRGLIAEGSRWLMLALDTCDDRSAERARALAAVCVLRLRQGRADDLIVLGDEIVALLSEQDDLAELAHARHQRAVLSFVVGDWAEADELGGAALRAATPFPAVAGSAHHLAGILALSRGDLAAAQVSLERAEQTLGTVAPDTAPYFTSITLAWVVDERNDVPLVFGEETLLLGRRLGAQQASGHIALARALTERLSGRADAALHIIDDARARFDALGDRYGQAHAAAQRGHTLRWIGDFVEADRALAESETVRRELRDHRAVAMALAGRATVAAASGDGAAARSRGREALQMMERTGDTAGIALNSTNLGVAELLLGEPAVALNWVKRSIDIGPIPGGQRAYSWMLLLQAHLLRELGDRDAANSAAVAARDAFSGLGERRGLAALQRACKAGLLSVPADKPS